MESLLLEVAGLPLHPLVVHAAVVLIPVAAIMVIAAVVVKRNPKLFPTAVILTWVATVFSILASQSGEALGEVIGTPGQHGEWGEALSPLMIGLAIVSTIAVIVRRSRSKLLTGLTQLAAAGLAIAALVMVVLVGHSGAEATWGGTLSPSDAAIEEPKANEPAALTEEPAPAVDETPSGYTLDDVAAHASADDCWIVVDGVVYDASGFSSRHPGGPTLIDQVCGTDATDAFRGQHGTGGRANTELAGFELGLLSQ
jgi:uncharacterized membrane protein